MDITSYLLGKKSGGGGSEPTGTINITSNGNHNVKSYATADVSVQPDLEAKSITITENTTTTITPTSGKDGISSVSITTNVPTGITPTGTITITENGTHDVTNYANASVNVSGGGAPKTLEEVNNIIYTYFQKYENLSNNYDTYTTDNVTLYTPHSDYKNYVIASESSGYYRIYWIKTNYILSKSSSNNFGAFGVFLPTQQINIVSNIELQTGTQLIPQYRSSQSYGTINECFQAMQNNTTTYTNRNNYIPAYDTGEYQIPYANVSILDTDKTTPLSSQKISSNETIEAMA